MVSNFARNMQNRRAFRDRECDNGIEPDDAKTSPRRRVMTTAVDDDDEVADMERADDECANRTSRPPPPTVVVVRHEINGGSLDLRTR